jgi:hypothetical protein
MSLISLCLVGCPGSKDGGNRLITDSDKLARIRSQPLNTPVNAFVHVCTKSVVFYGIPSQRSLLTGVTNRSNYRLPPPCHFIRPPFYDVRYFAPPDFIRSPRLPFLHLGRRERAFRGHHKLLPAPRAREVNAKHELHVLISVRLLHDHDVLRGERRRGVPPHERGPAGDEVWRENGAAEGELFEDERDVVFVYGQFSAKNPLRPRSGR